jgi:hypothetical protein
MQQRHEQFSHYWCMSMSMGGGVYAACFNYSICPCCVPLLNVHVVCPCCMSLLHVLAACPSCMSRLHVHGACRWCMSMLQVPVASSWCMSLVHVHAACPCCIFFVHAVRSYCMFKWQPMLHVLATCLFCLPDHAS